MRAMSMDSSYSEVAILSRVIHSDKSPLGPEAARALLALDFPEEDKRRMRSLTDKLSAGTITAEERGEMHSYTRVSHILALLQAKARHALREAGQSG
jgi:hypothetical protein